MRCPECTNENEEGAAFCATCGAPLTAYGGQVTGIVSHATREKAQRLAVRPVAVPVMAALDGLVILAYPVRSVLASLAGRTQLNSEGTNYIGTAVGAVGTVVTLVVMGIIALALALLAWGVWTQRTWAWYVQTGLVGLVGVIGLFVVGRSGLGGIVLIVAAGALLYLWLRPEARDWYGVR